VTDRGVSAADAALLDELVGRYPFKPYRNYRLLSRQRQAAVMRAEIDRALQSSGSISVGDGDADRAAIAIGRPLAWDSEFFRVPMGRLDYLLRGRSADRATLARVVRGALDAFRASGLEHITARVDVADADALAILEDAGFRLMDALVTYIAHPKRPAPRRVKDVGVIRQFVPADTDEVLAITRESYRGFPGRFQLDPHLPKDRSDEFYVEWARKCCAGTMADRIYVAEDTGGDLIGWASVKRAEPVSTVGGAPISSGSLGACRSDRPGAYAGLIRTAAVENHAVGVLTEAATQNSNFAMVRVLEAVGAQYARAEYTLHAWLG
jgi:hypothetical protein